MHRRCGRPVKEGELSLCGLHAGAAKRAAAHEAKWRAQAEASLKNTQRNSKLRKELEGKIRAKGWHEFIQVDRPDAGTVRLRWDDLIDLIRNA
jgi:hypothetical protein